MSYISLARKYTSALSCLKLYKVEIFIQAKYKGCNAYDKFASKPVFTHFLTQFVMPHSYIVVCSG